MFRQISPVVIAMVLLSFVKCSAQEWAWLNPQPAALTINAIWLDDSGQMVAVGDHGLLARYQQSGWIVDTPLVSVTLRGVWGSGIDDVFAVGDGGVILHWDGGEWFQMSSETVEDLWAVKGLAPDAVWAVGAHGTIRKWNGATWAGEPSGTIRTILTVLPTDDGKLYIAGQNRMIRVRDGATWSEIYCPASTYVLFNSLSQVGPAEIIVGGTYGTIRRIYAGACSEMNSGTTQDIYGVWSTGEGWAYAAGSGGTVLYWDGTSWSPQETGTTHTIRALSGLDAEYSVTAGEFGQVMVGQQGAWEFLSSGTTANIAGLHIARDGTPFAVSNTELLRQEAGGWTTMCGMLGKDVWAWDSEYALFTTGAIAYGLYSDGGCYDATQSMSFGTLGVWGNDPADIWLVGTSGGTCHWNGSAWSNRVSGTTVALNDVWCANSSCCFAVGNNGQVTRWNGTIWSLQPQVTNSNLWGVHGAAPDDIWAVGDSGTTLHFNGASWEYIFANTTAKLTSVYYSATGDVYAVGYNGMMVKWDGQVWAQMETPTNAHLRAICELSTGEILAAGDNGSVLRWAGAPLCFHSGDVNGDGVLSPGDAQISFQLYFYCQSMNPSHEQYCAADYCGLRPVAPCDGSVTPGDAAGIFATYLSLPDPCD